MGSVRRTDPILLRVFILGAILAGTLASAAALSETSVAAAPETTVPPLCDAAYRGDLPKVRALLLRGAAPDTHVDGATALMQSLQPFVAPPSLTMGKVSAKERRASTQRNEHKLQIALLLLSAGANVKLTDHSGATALHSAALAAGDEQSVVTVIRNLLRRGAIVDAQTANRVTPLQLAVWKRRFEVAKVLVGAGANLDARDSKGKSAADELVTQGSQGVLENLRKVGLRQGSGADR